MRRTQHVRSGASIHGWLQSETSRSRQPDSGTTETGGQERHKGLRGGACRAHLSQVSQVGIEGRVSLRACACRWGEQRTSPLRILPTYNLRVISTQKFQLRTRKLCTVPPTPSRSSKAKAVGNWPSPRSLRRCDEQRSPGDPDGVPGQGRTLGESTGIVPQRQTSVSTASLPSAHGDGAKLDGLHGVLSLTVVMFH